MGRQEQNLEQHYNEVLQTLSQRYHQRAGGLEEEKKVKLEALYAQLLLCGGALDRSKELIEAAQEVRRGPDPRLFLKVSGGPAHTGGVQIKNGRSIDLFVCLFVDRAPSPS